MGIEIRQANDPTMNLALKILGLTQSPVEPEAINAAGMLRNLMSKKNLNLHAFKPYIPGQGFAYMSDRLAYLWEKADPRPTPSPQDLREKAYADAQKALQETLVELERAKRFADVSDRLYRSRCKQNAVKRRTAELYVKEYLRMHRQCRKASKEALRAEILCWKRNPDKCPGDGWIWVRTHERKSRTGKDYTVEGHWRAPRKPKTNF
jgi:hypothetical protein